MCRTQSITIGSNSIYPCTLAHGKQQQQQLVINNVYFCRCPTEFIDEAHGAVATEETYRPCKLHLVSNCQEHRTHSAEISDETRNIIGRDAVMKMTSYKHWLNTRNMSKSCDTEKPSALCEKSAFLDEI